jgi:hypothetical protein
MKGAAEQALFMLSRLFGASSDWVSVSGSRNIFPFCDKYCGSAPEAEIGLRAYNIHVRSLFSCDKRAGSLGTRSINIERAAQVHVDVEFATK